ncbi:MAG TPA: DUF2480 family protein [Chitinophagaceae bacterium]|jgi:hypothetical protein|nr:DUF2480 family protein [Chitinophagaceae bacterium]
MSDQIINKVAESSIVEIDLEKFYPKEEIALFDMKDHLFMGLILKEKDFRETLKNTDFSIYSNKHVGVTCSADAIIPAWAYMLVAAYLQPFATDIVFGDERSYHQLLFTRNLHNIDIAEFYDKRVVVKGCGDLPIGEFAYLEITKLLRPVAKSIMYGEPCSTVPIFKKRVV